MLKKISLTTALLLTTNFTCFAAEDANFTWSSGATDIDSLGFSLMSTTTPLTGNEQTIQFLGQMEVHFLGQDIYSIESGLKWDLQGWKMFCRMSKNTEVLKTAFYPIRPGTEMTALLEVQALPDSTNSELVCTASAPGYPRVRIQEGPMPTSALHSEEILLRNENTNIDGNCSRLANTKAIYFNKINIKTTGQHYDQIDWDLDYNSDCKRSLKVINNHSENGQVVIYQDPHD